MRIPFGEWLPDLGSLDNPGCLVARNVVPFAGGYYPFPSAQVVSDDIAKYARGAISATASTGTSYNIAGDETKLYSLASGTWGDVTRAGGDYACDDEDVWDFAKFGDVVIATNGADEVQAITLGSSNFDDLAGSPPKAKCVAVIGDFVMLGNLESAPTSVRWSGFGDETQWATNPATQSDAQEIAGNYGPIRRIIGGAAGYIFHERGVTKATRVGPPEVFAFHQVERVHGAISHGAVCDAGNAIFYISQDDFYLLTDNGAQNIGANKIAKTFFADLQANYAYRISSAVDIVRSLAMWAYPGAGSFEGQPNKIIVYHWPSGRWAQAEIEVNSLYTFLSPGYTLDGLDALASSMGDLVAPLDSPVYQGGKLSVAGFNTANETVSFEGSPLDATIETTEVEPNPGGTGFLNEAQAIIEGAATITVEHGTRYLMSELPTYAAGVPVNAAGKFDLRKEARFHRLRCNLSGTWDKATEIRAVGKVGGKR